MSLDLNYTETFKRPSPDAYERLLMDVVQGNPTLFMRRDEVEAAWAWVEPILHRLDDSPSRGPTPLPGRHRRSHRRDHPHRARRPHLARRSNTMNHHPSRPGRRHRPHHRTQRRDPRRVPGADPRPPATAGPARGGLGCANLAHGFAASGKADKKALRGHGQAERRDRVGVQRHALRAPTLRAFPAQLKQAVLEAGGIAQFAGGVPAMCDGITQGRDGMQLSLFSRDVIAMSTAIALSHDMFDATLMLGVCDKIVPGLLIGALAFGHLPTVFVPAGPDDLRVCRTR